MNRREREIAMRVAEHRTAMLGDGTSPGVALPFRAAWPLLAGAFLGVVLRLVFSGDPGHKLDAMTDAFILLVPAAVGAVTVYVAERSARRSWGYYIAAAVLSNVLFVCGTMLIMIEGLICAIVIVPLFACIGAVGGLIMGAVCRYTRWPKSSVQALAALPLVLAAVRPDGAGPTSLGEVERHVYIGAPATAVWQQLLDTRDIKPAEVEHAWVYRIGVPLPVAGVGERTPDTLVRHVTMGKAIHFDQVATEWKDGAYVRWRYRFAPDSFPPHALDDHVQIGGHYFDLIDTEYSIEPAGPHSTSLRIRMHYRVSTRFNWYADAVARTLMGNWADMALDLYRHRSERAL